MNFIQHAGISIGISQFLFTGVKGHNFAIFCAMLVKIGPLTLDIMCEILVKIGAVTSEFKRAKLEMCHDSAAIDDHRSFGTLAF